MWTSLITTVLVAPAARGACGSGGRGAGAVHQSRCGSGSILRASNSSAMPSVKRSEPGGVAVLQALVQERREPLRDVPEPPAVEAELLVRVVRGASADERERDALERGGDRGLGAWCEADPGGAALLALLVGDRRAREPDERREAVRRRRGRGLRADAVVRLEQRRDRRCQLRVD